MAAYTVNSTDQLCLCEERQCGSWGIESGIEQVVYHVMSHVMSTGLLAMTRIKDSLRKAVRSIQAGVPIFVFRNCILWMNMCVCTGCVMGSCRAESCELCCIHCCRVVEARC